MIRETTPGICETIDPDYICIMRSVHWRVIELVNVRFDTKYVLQLSVAHSAVSRCFQQRSVWWESRTAVIIGKMLTIWTNRGVLITASTAMSARVISLLLPESVICTIKSLNTGLTLYRTEIIQDSPLYRACGGNPMCSYINNPFKPLVFQSKHDSVQFWGGWLYNWNHRYSSHGNMRQTQA